MIVEMICSDCDDGALVTSNEDGDSCDARVVL